MKAIIFDKKQSPHKQRLENVLSPLPKDNEVLVKVVSASINAADYRSIKMGMSPKKKMFGSAVSGVVESVGKNVQQFKPGDGVLGDLTDSGFGGLAEYVAAPDKAWAIKPANTSFEDVATLPVAATTALQALRDKGHIQKDQNVLIVGGAGGVGTFAVQLAKYYGAFVTAVSSTKNIEQTLLLGADKVIDYTKEDFTKGSNCYDIILAINGNYPLLGYRRIMKSNGIYVLVGGALMQIIKSMLFGWLLSLGGKKMKFLPAKSDPKDLEFVAKLMDEGRINAVIERRYSLDNGVEAMTYLSNGHATGKVVINVQS